MKYIFSIIIFIAITFTSTLNAQIPPGYNALGKFHIDLPFGSCYAQADYPTIDDLIDDLLIQYLGYSFCSSNCPFQPLPSCIALFLNQDLSVTLTNSKWCFIAEPKFQWICGPAVAASDPAIVTATPDNSVVDVPFGDEPEPHKRHVTAQKIITGIFPNPTKGKMQLLLDHQYGQLPDLLIVTDWTGKKIQEAPLNLEAHIINKLNLDLSDQPDGFYLATFYSPDGSLHTEKIVLQQ